MASIPIPDTTMKYSRAQRPMAVVASAGQSTSQYRHLTALKSTTVGRYLCAWHRAFTWPQRIAILLMVAGGLLRGWWALTAGV